MVAAFVCIRRLPVPPAFLFALALINAHSALAAVLGSFGGDPSAASGADSQPTQPQRFIVEFDSTDHLSATLQTRGHTPHRRFYDDLAARGVAYEVQGEYHEELFVGASVEVKSAADVDKLSEAEGVVNVYPVQYYDAPKPVPATREAALSGDLSRRSLTPRADSLSYSAWSPLPAIQVDRAHALGHTGAGVKVGIIDAGVDYNLAALGGGLGPGFKVEGGYDFVGASYGNGGAPQPSGNPLDTCNGHGTLVAGLIGGNATEYGTPGAAPDAKIYAYRVFGCTGSTPDDIVISAMLRAVNDGCKIINLSLGSPSGWSTSASATVAGRISQSGVQIVASAGNDGLNGAFYAASPSAGRGVLSVGSTDTDGDLLIGCTARFSDSLTINITYSAFTPLPDGQHLLYATDARACSDDDLGDAPVDLTGWVVVVQRGTCSATTKAQTAMKRGAAAVLIYKDSAGLVYVTDPPTNVRYLSQADGTRLVQLYREAKQAGEFSSITFARDFVRSGNPSAGRMSYFSSIGPTFDMVGAPQVVAPGQNIFGPAPAAMGTWTYLSGTSFSAPLTAGVAAVWMSAKGQDVAALRAALQTTAKPVSVPGGLESVAYAGGGLVSALDAIRSDTVISPSEIMVNDTQYSAGSRYVSITNTGSEARTYTLTHEPAATIYNFVSGANFTADNPDHDLAPNTFASVSFTQSRFSLGPGQSTSVLFNIRAPQIASSRLPIYSGYVLISGGAVPVRLLYLGAAARLRDEPSFESSSRYFGYRTPVLLSGLSATRSTDGQVYSFSGTSYPSVLWRMLVATRIVSIDLVDARATLGVNPAYAAKRDLVVEAEDVDASPGLTADAVEALIDNAEELWQDGSNAQLTADTGPGTLQRRQRTESQLAFLCRVTNGRAAACRGGQGASLPYSGVPTKGNVYTVNLSARSHNNAAGNQRGRGDSYYLRIEQGLLSNGQIVPDGDYKILMRALKINGDRNKQVDYDTWLSPRFTVKR